MKTVSLIALIGILLLSILVRLYRFSNPIADWHSWRQADTSAVSRSFVERGFDILHPRFEDISNVASGKDNPQGYRFVEFPIFNIAQAELYLIFHTLTLEEWGRVVSILASLGTSLALYLLLRRHANETIGFFAALIAAILPYAIYYGRTVLPDYAMTASVLFGIYFFDRWIENKMLPLINIDFFFALLCTAGSLLLKPYALFFLPSFLFLALRTFRKHVFITFKFYLFIIIAFLPLILWRLWMTQYPAGIPVNDWLFNGGNIRFTGAFFYWLFADRIARLMLGYWGLPIFILGILSVSKRSSHIDSGFFFSFLLSSLLYLTVIARGNVQHDYYQILILPSIVMFVSVGFWFLIFSAKEHFSLITSYSVAIISFLFMLSFGWYFVRDYFNINNPSVIAAGNAVRQLTPKNAKIIAPYDGDTTLLYQTDRQGWPSFEKSLPELIQMGAEYLLLVNPKPQDFDFGKSYQLVASSPQFVIFDLTRKP